MLYTLADDPDVSLVEVLVSILKMRASRLLWLAFLDILSYVEPVKFVCLCRSRAW